MGAGVGGDLLATMQQDPALAIGAALVLGLIVGSFLNVVIYRLPIMMQRQWDADVAHWQAERSAIEPTDAAALPAAPGDDDAHVASDIVSDALPDTEAVDEPVFNLAQPRSACPRCGRPIRALENIPVISWLGLRGRCRGCAEPISVRYPLVELLTGLLTLAVALRFGIGVEALAAMLLTWYLVALSGIDIDHQLLPDSMTLMLLWIGLFLSLFNVAGAERLFIEPADAIAGALAGYLALWLVYQAFRLVTGKEGMGYGDFKLLAALGAWLGWQLLPLIIILSALVGSVYGIAMIVLRRRQRGVPMPFGPWLAMAGWLVLMYGDRLNGWYFELMGL
jgi:leader peptidase (prepilin peptidase)/N-methyltransferase